MKHLLSFLLSLFLVAVASAADDVPSLESLVAKLDDVSGWVVVFWASVAGLLTASAFVGVGLLYLRKLERDDYR